MMWDRGLDWALETENGEWVKSVPNEPWVPCGSLAFPNSQSEKYTTAKFAFLWSWRDFNHPKDFAPVCSRRADKTRTSSAYPLNSTTVQFWSPRWRCWETNISFWNKFDFPTHSTPRMAEKKRPKFKGMYSHLNFSDVSLPCCPFLNRSICKSENTWHNQKNPLTREWEAKWTLPKSKVLCRTDRHRNAMDAHSRETTFAPNPN